MVLIWIYYHNQIKLFNGHLQINTMLICLPMSFKNFYFFVQHILIELIIYNQRKSIVTTENKKYEKNPIIDLF